MSEDTKKPEAAPKGQIELDKLHPAQALGFVNQYLRKLRELSLDDARLIEASLLCLKKTVVEHSNLMKRRSDVVKPAQRKPPVKKVAKKKVAKKNGRAAPKR